VKRIAAALILAAALPLSAQPNQAAYRLDTVATRLDGQAGGINYSTLPAPSGCVATNLAVFLGSPARLNCDSALTFNGTTDTLATGTVTANNVTATALATPGSITVTPQGTGGAVTWTYKLVARLADGTTTEAGAASSTAVGNATLSAGNFNRLAWSAVTGATDYRVYRTVAGTSPATTGIIYTGTALTVDDTGLAGGGETPPTVNGTGILTGKFADGTVSTLGVAFMGGSRIFRGASTGAIVFAPGGYGRAKVGGSGVLSLQVQTTGSIGWTAGEVTDGSTSEALITGVGAAKIQLGANNAAVPVAQTFGVQNATGTNANAAATFTFIGPLGTNQGTAGSNVWQTGYPAAGTGSSAHTPSTRRYESGKWTTLTESSATDVATITFGASAAVVSEFLVTIEANDGTEYQSMSYRVRVNSVRKATGNTVSTVGIVDDANAPAVATSAGGGTLTATFAVTEGASAATLTVNAVSSLTQTTLRANVQAVANGPGVTLSQL